MTNAQDPADPNARRDGAPPTQQPPPFSGDAVAELPGDAPAASSSQQNGSQGSNSAAERPRINKPEGSGYASSYRPSDAQSDPPAVCVYALYVGATY